MHTFESDSQVSGQQGEKLKLVITRCGIPRFRVVTKRERGGKRKRARYRWREGEAT